MNADDRLVLSSMFKFVMRALFLTLHLLMPIAAGEATPPDSYAAVEQLGKDYSKFSNKGLDRWVRSGSPFSKSS